MRGRRNRWRSRWITSVQRADVVGLPRRSAGAPSKAGAERNLASDFAAKHRPEQLPGLALESSELHLLDRSEIDRAGVDRDAGQEVGGSEVLQICGLSHHVLACEIIAA